MLGGKESFWYGKERKKKRGKQAKNWKKMQKKRTKTRGGPEGEDNMGYLMPMMV